MSDEIKNDQLVTQKASVSSINRPWQLSKIKTTKSEKESEEWPSLENSVKLDKATTVRPRERHSTGNSFDDKISKLKWEKLNFDITYQSKDRNLSDSSSFQRNHRNESHDYDKENDSTNRNKKSRTYIKHPRANRDDDQGSHNKYHGNAGNRSNYHLYNNIHGYGFPASNIQMLNMQYLSRANHKLSYLMLYPAVGKNMPTQSDENGREIPSVPPACICILPPGTNQQQASALLIRQQVQKQIEFYFTPENLLHDKYLRENMTAEGWVSISLIAKFKRVATLTQNLSEVIEAIKGSQNLEFEAKTISVRTKHNPNIWPIKQISLDDKNSLKVDSYNSLILNYLVVLFPSYYLDKKCDQEDSVLLSKQIGVISTALNKFSNDVHLKARVRINDYNIGFMPSLSMHNPSLVSGSSMYQEKSQVDRNSAGSKETNNLMPTNQGYSSSSYYSNQVYPHNYSAEMPNPFLQQDWINQQYMFDNNFHVSNSSNLQMMHQNSIHAIPVIYMRRDGTISYFEQNQYSPSMINNNNTISANQSQPSQEISNPNNPNENNTTIPLNSSPNDIQSSEDHQNLPFFQIINNLSSSVSFKVLNSFQSADSVEENSKNNMKKNFGFLFNSLPNQKSILCSDGDEKNEHGFISNSSDGNSFRTLKNHPIKDFFKMNKITMYPYEEFEKLCFSVETSDNSLNFECLCEFWSFFLKLNPIQELIINYRKILNENSTKFSDSDKRQHYSKTLFAIYRQLPSQVILDIQEIILLDLENYFKKFDDQNLQFFEDSKDNLSLASDAPQKLSILQKLLEFKIPE